MKRTKTHRGLVRRGLRSKGPMDAVTCEGGRITVPEKGLKQSDDCGDELGFRFWDSTHTENVASVPVIEVFDLRLHLRESRGK